MCLSGLRPALYSRIFVTCDFYAGCSRRDFLFRTAKSIKTVTAFQTLVETDTDEHQLERRHRPSVRYCAGLETVTTAAGARTAGAAARDGRGLWTRASHPWSLSFPLRLSPSLSSRTARDHREASSPTLFPTPNHNRQTEGPQRLGGGEALRGAQALARGAPAEGSPRACLGNRSPASLGLGIGSIARGRSPSSLQGPRLSLSPCSPSRSPLKMRKISGK